MIEVSTPGIDPQALATRVQEILLRADLPKEEGHSRISPLRHALRRLHSHLDSASDAWAVGLRLPPMSRRRGVVRLLATPLAKTVLRAAQLVARDQRTFNESVVGALKALQDALSQLARAPLEAELDEEADASTRSAPAHRDGADVQDARKHLVRLDRAVARARGEIAALERMRLELVKPLLATTGRAPTDTPDEVASRDSLYADFENRFRGARPEIRARVQVHVGPLRAAANVTQCPILELGSGRGELLSLLNEDGVPSRGVDTNSLFVSECRQQGLEVTNQDAIDSLQQLSAQALGGIVALHLAEHLPADTLQLLLKEAKRVLAPGGILLLETPNPQNLVVGACTFWLDPTHQKPLHPDTLSFLLESAGFVRISITWLHPAEKFEQISDPLVRELLAAPQDYAVVGYAPLQQGAK